MGRQLNIRSDDAYTLAHKIADQLDVPVAEAVTRALRDYAANLPCEREISEAEAKARAEAFRAMVRKWRAHIRPDAGDDWSHDYLYDDDGLPK